MSSFTLPNANTWAAEDFKTVDNPDGTRTYFLAADDVHRGIDVVSWTGEPNPIGTPAPVSLAATSTSTMDVGLLGAAALLLPAAAVFGRRRRRTTRTL